MSSHPLRNTLSGLFSGRPSFRALIDRLNDVRLSDPDALDAPRPRIHPGTTHYEYATLTVGAGVPNADACAILGISARTAEEYRGQLRADARRYYGREVSYDWAVRQILQLEWSALVDRPTAPAQPKECIAVAAIAPAQSKEVRAAAAAVTV